MSTANSIFAVFTEIVDVIRPLTDRVIYASVWRVDGWPQRWPVPPVNFRRIT